MKTIYLFLEVSDFDSDEYIQATFSPPSTSPTQSESVQETKPTMYVVECLI